MPVEELVSELSGVISGLSHIFRLNEQELFFIDVSSAAESTLIVIRRPSQLGWQSILNVGMCYSFTNLRPGKLYQSTPDEVDVLVATSKTNVNPTKYDDYKLASNASLHHLISFKGLVTSVDAVLQLFGLDESVELALAAIAGVTSCPQLRLGDQVVVHDAHWAPAARRLTACGRTRVDLLNRQASAAACDQDSALHLLHRLALPPAALDWYRRTERELADAVPHRT
ncbi:uncharacterized protein LOC119113601 [Pollicipes pollicipes]|uniref:uncharacterized protein LOC119113601 n=1 Tax=Pollicipes pollicipes TaxID=41117 RepID=UPI001884B74A|nr:uncharacterized protein LOC119113601 [Pollicipes pollicipes]